MNPYYDEDGITIYHGDCRDVLPTLAYDAVVTDPPYGVQAKERPHATSGGAVARWDDVVPYDLLGQFGTAPVVWFGAAPQMPEAFALFDPTPDRVLMWAPRFTLSLVAKGGIAYRYHPIYTWRLPVVKPTVHDVFTDNTECGNWWFHQATKPITLMRRLVQLTAGAVIDPFMGSGTTLRAAKDLSRQAIGIELEERYCEIAAKRLSQGVLNFGSSAGLQA